MKARQTLLLMLWNPMSFIAYFLACWILFSATFTMWDESFRYGTWPDVAAAAEGTFANLPDGYTSSDLQLPRGERHCKRHR